MEVFLDFFFASLGIVCSILIYKTAIWCAKWIRRRIFYSKLLTALKELNRSIEMFQYEFDEDMEE